MAAERSDSQETLAQAASVIGAAAAGATTAGDVAVVGAAVGDAVAGSAAFAGSAVPDGTVAAGGADAAADAASATATDTVAADDDAAADGTAASSAAAADASAAVADAAAAADGSTAGARDSHPFRPLLSFVRRSGRLDARLQRAWDAYGERYLLDINDGEGSLRLRPGCTLDSAFVERHWGDDHSLTVEIGTGQGENIVAAAQSHPDRNYLALEVYDPGVAHTMLLAGKNDLTNLRIARINAPDLFASARAGVVAEVWTFFPDPWPKMKHHKRRIVQPKLADDVHRALVADGVWCIATDIEDYALHVHEVMDGRVGWRLEEDVTVSLPTGHVGKGNADDARQLPHADFPESSRFEGRVLTNFEKKGIAAGRVIHDFAYRAV